MVTGVGGHDLQCFLEQIKTKSPNCASFETFQTTSRYIVHSSYICRTDPADVARVEGKTFICTREKFKTVPHMMEGAKGGLGLWMDPQQMDKELKDRFPGCMAGEQVAGWPLAVATYYHIWPPGEGCIICQVVHPLFTLYASSVVSQSSSILSSLRLQLKSLMLVTTVHCCPTPVIQASASKLWLAHAERVEREAR